MLTRLTSILLILALSFQCLIKLGIVLDYSVNKVSITNKYCVNKAKPMMHCDGKCHLAKALKKADDDKQGSERKGESKIEWPVFLLPSSFNAGPFYKTAVYKTAYPDFLSGKPSKISASLFRPPATLS